MTVHLQCDYCGQPISDDRYVKITALGRQSESYGSHWSLVNEYLGHFHANEERSCYSDLWEQIYLVLSTHSSLERIPVATLRTKTPPHESTSDRGERQAATHAFNQDWEEAKRAWEAADRVALVLRVLAGERLTISEATTRINAELGHPSTLKFPPVHAPYIRYLLKRMLDAGQIERVQETFRNKPRYRYFRAEAVA